MYPETGSDKLNVSPWFEQHLEDEKRKSVDLPSKLFAVDAHLAGSNVTLSLRLSSQHLVLSEKRDTVSIQCCGHVIISFASGSTDP
jgi:hypothetical protein